LAPSCHEISEEGGQEERNKAKQFILSVELSTTNSQIIYFEKNSSPLKYSLIAVMSASSGVNHMNIKITPV
jgi:hypothetical protein